MGVGGDQRSCIFKSARQLNGFELQNSSLIIREKQAVPDNQGWSRCQHCGWFDSRFHLYNSLITKAEDLNNETIDLSWSLWGEFFFNKRNDQLKASARLWSDLKIITQCDQDRSYGSFRDCVAANNISADGESHVLSKRFYVVDRPVYILPMITLHVGHIIIDLLEQVILHLIETGSAPLATDQ
jgi:hypothetical protein